MQAIDPAVCAMERMVLLWVSLSEEPFLDVLLLPVSTATRQP